MTTKFDTQRSFWIVILILLTACAPAQPNISEIQTKAVAMSKTSIALTQMALPTITQPPLISTPTATLDLFPPTPYTTQLPIFIITPNAIQVERWKEYQTALAKSLLPYRSSNIVLCEWAILGQFGQEVYVWAVCSGDGERTSAPAVIYLDTDGAIQTVESVQHGSSWDSDIQRLFPSGIQEILSGDLVSTINIHLKGHLDRRLIHFEEPPLVVLSATPTAAPTP